MLTIVLLRPMLVHMHLPTLLSVIDNNNNNKLETDRTLSTNMHVPSIDVTNRWYKEIEDIVN